MRQFAVVVLVLSTLGTAGCLPAYRAGRSHCKPGYCQTRAASSCDSKQQRRSHCKTPMTTVESGSQHQCLCQQPATVNEPAPHTPSTENSSEPPQPAEPQVLLNTNSKPWPKVSSIEQQ